MAARSNNSLQLLKGYIGSHRVGPTASEETLPQPFVSVSRQIGAGGFTIGERLCKQLSDEDKHAPRAWMWFDRELVRKTMEDHALTPELTARLTDTPHNELLTWFDDAFTSHPSWSSLVRKMGETILQLAQIGNVILVGRGAHLLTRGMPYGLHVRLVASDASRVQQVQQSFGYGREAAERFMRKEDKSKEKYVRQYFDRDIADPNDYDLTINTDHISHEDTAALITAQVLRIRARIREEHHLDSGRRAPAR